MFQYFILKITSLEPTICNYTYKTQAEKPKN